MTITLDDFLNNLSPEHREAVDRRGRELIQEKQNFENAFDFFFNIIKDNINLTPEEIQEGRETAPTVHELAAAVYTAVDTGYSLEESFEAALVIINHWGKLEEDKDELTYDEAIRTLAAKEEFVEEMKAERADFTEVFNTIELCTLIGKSEFDVIHAGLRVLYEYHLWDLKTLEGKKENEVESPSETEEA